MRRPKNIAHTSLRSDGSFAYHYCACLCMFTYFFNKIQMSIETVARAVQNHLSWFEL